MTNGQLRRHRDGPARIRPAIAVAALVAAGLGLGSGSATASARVDSSAGSRAGSSAGGRAFQRGSGKLSPRLQTLAATPSYASTRSEAAALSLPESGAGSIVREPGGRVLVEVRTNGHPTAAVSTLRALGARIVNVSPTYATVTAAVRPDALDAIARDPAVAYAHEVLAPITARVPTLAGSRSAAKSASACAPTISEGDTLMKVAAARAAKNVDGAGQTIGILSDSFDTNAAAPTHAAQDIATGDLPGPGNPCGYTTPVTVQSQDAGGTDEGRALAELAHGLAPGAHLVFATAGNGPLDFANQITTLRTVNHATVIVDDAAYMDEPFFQDGPVAQAANAASAAGVTYFSAAGNDNVIVNGANVSSYEAPAFRSTACPASVVAAEPLMGCHNFNATGGTNNSDAITLAPGGGFGFDMQWAQPFGITGTDLAVFLLDSSGKVVAGSDEVQSLSREPIEFLGYTNLTKSAQTVRIVIGKFSGATNPLLKFNLVSAFGITAVQFDTSIGGDIVGPTIDGHAGAATVGSTAAIPYDNSSRPEEYSSRGPVTLYYQPTPSTTPFDTPEVLAKPDFAATDNVRTKFFFALSGGTYRLPGTSASAPQAAAIGALLREYDPALSPAQVMATLRATAAPVPTDGTETDVGGGYLDADAALASVVPLPGAPNISSAASGDARATVHWSAAAANPNFPITAYRVTPSLAGAPQAPQVFNSGLTNQVVTGLTNGGSYSFTVAAIDANGAGPESAPSGVTVIGEPGPPTAVAAVPGNGTATVHWSVPAANGSVITGYSIQIFLAGTSRGAVSVNAAKTSQSFAHLAQGGRYTFEVSAANARGSGPFSAASAAIIVGAPRAPTGVTAKARHRTASVHWTAPSNNGRAITGYTVTPYIGSAAQTPRVFHSAATTQTIPGLSSGGHYTFRVSATNPRGTGPGSSASNAVTVT